MALDCFAKLLDNDVMVTLIIMIMHRMERKKEFYFAKFTRPKWANSGETQSGRKNGAVSGRAVV